MVPLKKNYGAAVRKVLALLYMAILCVVFRNLADRYEEGGEAGAERLREAAGGTCSGADPAAAMLSGGEGERKVVALTFDDGPNPATTARLLDGLKARGVTASFFVLGMNAEAYPELIQRMSGDGHLIGNHTYHHVQLNAVSREQVCQEVEATNDTLRSILGSEPIYLRPPFGAWDRKDASLDDMIPVYWDVDSLDWKIRDADIVAERVLSEVESGDIILLHDLYDTSVEAAFQIADALLGQGYEFVTVDEIFFD